MSRRYLLDTGPAQDCLFRRKGVDQRVVEKRQAGLIVGICTPVLGEIWAGIEASHTREKNAVVVRRNLRSLRVWPFTNEAAKEYGRIFAALRARGTIIQQVDMQLAAVALTLGDCTVVTNDSDLAAVPGLILESWAP